MDLERTNKLVDKTNCNAKPGGATQAGNTSRAQGAPLKPACNIETDTGRCGLATRLAHSPSVQFGLRARLPRVYDALELIHCNESLPMPERLTSTFVTNQWI